MSETALCPLQRLVDKVLDFESIPRGPSVLPLGSSPVSLVRTTDGRIIWLSISRHPGTQAIGRIWIRLHERAPSPSDVIAEEQYSLTPQTGGWDLQRSLSLEHDDDDPFQIPPADQLEHILQLGETEQITKAQELLVLLVGASRVSLDELFD